MSRILVCGCGLYLSFGHGDNDLFYSMKFDCPICGNELGFGSEKVTADEFLQKMLATKPPIFVIRGAELKEK